MDIALIIDFNQVVEDWFIDNPAVQVSFSCFAYFPKNDSYRISLDLNDMPGKAVHITVPAAEINENGFNTVRQKLDSLKPMLSQIGQATEAIRQKASVVS